MTDPPTQRLLFGAPSVDCDAVVVNDRVVVRTAAGMRLAIVDGLVVHSFAVDDRVAQSYAAIMLVEAGYAAQKEVARAFGCSSRKVRRDQARYERGGMAALGRRPGRPVGSRPVGKLGGVRDRAVLGMKAEGLSNREIARRLGIDEKAVRKRLRRLGWEPPSTQAHLFADDEDPEPPEPPPHGPPRGDVDAPAPTAGTAPEPAAAAEVASPPCSFDADPLNRRQDRLAAKLGLLDDAVPLFASATGVPRGGVLLSVPALVESGVLDVAQQVYGPASLAPAFYGLRTVIVTLIVLSLLRINRPEGLKEYSPAELGRILGLDRAPEVKTLRRKLKRLARCRQAERLGRELARQRVARRGQMLGFLYVDGHVRVYHGKHSIPKTHVPQMRLSLPATTDYWVNDAHGEPLFVVTAEANAGMHKMLVKVTTELRALLGAKSRPTIVFDRGGWSPKLFAELLGRGFDILTYKKGRREPIAEEAFVVHEGEVDARALTYRLHERLVQLLKGKLILREVTRLTDDGHQTAILTSRVDLLPLEVAYRMFERWRQENFFKYLVYEYEIDALVDYEVEPDDPERTVPNPNRRAVDAELAAARAELRTLLEDYGAAAVDNPEAARPTMRGFKIAHGKVGKKIRALRARIGDIMRKRAAIDQRVPVGQALGGRPVVKLSTERKHLTNVLKMVAFQIESDLLELVRPHYPRTDDEGRTLVQSALRATASLAPCREHLRVILDPLSSPHRSRAIAALCDHLDRAAVRYPGTPQTLRYEVRLRHAG